MTNERREPRIISAMRIDKEIYHLLTDYGGTTLIGDEYEFVERAAFSECQAEVEKLKYEIEALTHEGRQGELEQANVGLAEENAKLTAELAAVENNCSNLRKELSLARKELDEMRDLIKHALEMGHFRIGGSTAAWAERLLQHYRKDQGEE